MTDPRRSTGSVLAAPEPTSRPLLSVVVPVYNGGEEIVDNVGVIGRAIADGLGDEDFELVVVSDGSIDGTAERLLGERVPGLRVIHYDRNLGKGYAVKAGALVAHGEWVAVVDADLDLDPGEIPAYLDVARRERLDLAIGSKRHPDSLVHYPRSRRVASRAYQLLNRVLFRLDIRDTQVGLKVIRREVVERVMPLLLVKRFAFDLELLAVANALGYDRVRELPVRLEYRFTGSGVRSRAVTRALWDTAAVFYRLRVLHTYQRKRDLLGPGLPPPDELPVVTLLGDPEVAALLDYERLVVGDERTVDGDLVAVLAPGARPAGNWVTASVPYLTPGGASAVVAATVAPLSGPRSQQAAAAILESRLGGGSRRFRYFPGNVRVVLDYPAHTCVARREDYLAARDAGIDGEHLVSWLAERGGRTVYTPDTAIVASPPPLFRPHLQGVLAHARARGAAARRSHGRSLSGATLLSLLPLGAALAGGVLVVVGSAAAREVGVALVAAFALLLAWSALFASVRFRSLGTGALAGLGLVPTHAGYVAGFLVGFARGR